MNKTVAMLFAVTLFGCQQADQSEPDTVPSEAMPAPELPDTAANSAPDSLADLLAAQADDIRARYEYRHPQETIEFIGIEPGMVVVEGLPGRGWYTKVLLQYLGETGRLIGVDYELEIWPLFPFGTEEFVEGRRNWIADFTADAEEWRGENGAGVSAFLFGSMPEDYAGTADVVFFPRVLHNLANFQNAGNGEYLTRALADAYAILKPGGIFGVVQHQARDDMSDEFANGAQGYLKKSYVIEKVQAAGFELVAESDINQNALDQPKAEDIVWRLPPTLLTSKEDDALKAEYLAVGESNRMTLKFRKPL